MSNNIQQYNGGNSGGRPDVGRILMIAAAAYAFLPDLVPGPIDDGGVVILALVVVGIMSLFQGGN